MLRLKVIYTPNILTPFRALDSNFRVNLCDYLVTHSHEIISPPPIILWWQQIAIHPVLGHS